MVVDSHTSSHFDLVGSLATGCFLAGLNESILDQIDSIGQINSSILRIMKSTSASVRLADEGKFNPILDKQSATGN